MEINSLIQYLRYKRHIEDYMYLSAAALLIYDCFLTLHLEIKFIWLAKWTYTTALFLLVKYLALTTVILVLWLQIWPDLSSETCKAVESALTCTSTLLVLLTEIILSLRTWAIWRQNKIIGIGLGVMTIAHFALQCYIAITVIKSSVLSAPPYPGFKGCFITKASTIAWATFASSSAVEAIVLVLMVISAFWWSCRFGNGSKLSRIIHRDGILFYVYLLVFNALNLAFIFATPLDLMLSATPLQISLYAVLTCRIVLSIRAVSHQGLHSELHTITTYELS